MCLVTVSRLDHWVNVFSYSVEASGAASLSSLFPNKLLVIKTNYHGGACLVYTVYSDHIFPKCTLWWSFLKLCTLTWKKNKKQKTHLPQWFESSIVVKHLLSCQCVPSGSASQTDWPMILDENWQAGLWIQYLLFSQCWGCWLSDVHWLNHSKLS